MEPIQAHWFSFKDSCVSVIERKAAAKEDYSRTTLFFVHGRFGEAHAWEPVIEGLSSSFRCIAVDLPGFGKSFSSLGRALTVFEHADLVSRLIQYFSRPFEKMILVGHDSGGGIVQLASLQSAAQIEGLVLVNSSGIFQKLSSIRRGLLGRLAHQRVMQLIKEASGISTSSRSLLQEPWSHWNSRIEMLHSLEAIEKSWPQGHEQASLKQALHKLKIPLLILWGKKDSMNSVETGTELVRGLPVTRLSIHEKTGHWPFLEKPHWVQEKMKEFLFKADYGYRPNASQISLLK